MSALFQRGRILDYPYLIGRRNASSTYRVGTESHTRTMPRGICLLAYTTGYYHWLLEGIPRILDIIDDGLDFDDYPLILPPLAAYQHQMLALLGISPSRQVVTVAKGDWCHVTECIFPTAPFPFGAPELEDPSGQPDRTLLLRIRDRLLQKLALVPEEAAFPAGPVVSTKLYLSRAKAAKRKFNATTEAAVASLLESAGYRTIYLEDYPWQTQVRLLLAAESIVGFHGAGLANILFSPARRLLEFHNPMEVRPYFAVIARELAIEYECIVGTLVGDSPHFDNITIDVDLLQAKMREWDRA